MTPEAIRTIRKTLGLSQERFAQKLGVSFATVNRWEKGRSKPTGLSVGILESVRMAEVPGVDPNKPSEEKKSRKGKVKR